MSSFLERRGSALQAPASRGITPASPTASGLPMSKCIDCAVFLDFGEFTADKTGGSLVWMETVCQKELAIMRTAIAAWLLVLLLAPLAGCNCFSCIEQPYIPSSCSGHWDPVLGSCEQCGVCGGACQGHTPASYMKHRLTCGAGCGEIYWDEWLSDPPDDCDPCDDCGNWIGPRCCEPSFWQRVSGGWCSFWGFRSSGCATCLTLGTPCSECSGGFSGGKGNYVDLAPLQIAPEGAAPETVLPPPPIESPSDEATAPAAQSSPRSVLRSVRFH